MQYQEPPSCRTEPLSHVWSLICQMDHDDLFIDLNIYLELQHVHTNTNKT